MPSKATEAGVAAELGESLSPPIAFKTIYRVKLRKPRPRAGSPVGVLKIYLVMQNTQKKTNFGATLFATLRTKMILFVFRS